MRVEYENSLLLWVVTFYQTILRIESKESLLYYNIANTKDWEKANITAIEIA